jgi:hypothetical protein
VPLDMEHVVGGVQVIVAQPVAAVVEELLWLLLLEAALDELVTAADVVD